VTAGEITELVDGGRQHGASMFPIPRREIGPAAKEGDTKRSSANNHWPIIVAPELIADQFVASLQRHFREKRAGAGVTVSSDGRPVALSHGGFRHFS
jgi:hypothetical protein